MQDNATKNQQSLGAYLKALNILFYAIFTGQLLFAFIIYVLLKINAARAMPQNEQRVFEYVVPVVLFLCMAASWTLFKKRIELIKQETNLSAQLNAYRALYILRFALAEAPVLFALIILFVSGAQIIWLFVLIGIVSFITLRPTKERITKELELSSNDMDELEGVDEIKEQ